MESVAVDRSFVEFLLRRGDTVLVLGQQLAQWTGHAPILEEDLALTNVALDLVGQARMWLAYAGETEGCGRDEDRLAFFRDSREFRNMLVVEQRNGDYADTTARSFVFDTWHYYLLRSLGESADERVAAIASKAVREVAYHVRRSSDWIVRLGDGTDYSHARMQAAMNDIWPYTGELFLADEIDAEMSRRGVGPELAALREPWLIHLRRVLADATLEPPQDGWMQTGGKVGKHSEHLGYLLAEMQSVRRAVPGDRW